MNRRLFFKRAATLAAGAAVAPFVKIEGGDAPMSTNQEAMDAILSVDDPGYEERLALHNSLLPPLGPHEWVEPPLWPVSYTTFPRSWEEGL